MRCILSSPLLRLSFLTLHLNCIYELKRLRWWRVSVAWLSVQHRTVCFFFHSPHCIPALMIYSVVYWPRSLSARRPAPSFPPLSSSWVGVERWRAFFSKPPVAMFLSLLWSPKINQKTSVFVMVEDNQFPMRRREKDRNQKRQKLEERKLRKRKGRVAVKRLRFKDRERKILREMTEFSSKHWPLSPIKTTTFRDCTVSHL